MQLHMTSASFRASNNLGWDRIGGSFVSAGLYTPPSTNQRPAEQTERPNSAPAHTPDQKETTGSAVAPVPKVPASNLTPETPAQCQHCGQQEEKGWWDKFRITAHNRLDHFFCLRTSTPQKPSPSLDKYQQLVIRRNLADLQRLRTPKTPPRQPRPSRVSGHKGPKFSARQRRELALSLAAKRKPKT